MTRLRRRGVIAGTTLLIAAGLVSAVVVRSGAQESAALAATTAPAVQGTDVSNLTTVTSWPAVKAAGMSFVGVLAFDGASVSNPSYQTQVAGALDAGLFVMPYVVGDPLKVATGGDQFTDKAWAVINSVAAAPYAAGGEYLPIALDMENQPQVTPKYCYGLSPAQMVSWISQFIAAAKAKTGVSPVVYANPNWWQQCTGNTKAFAAADPLWVADYNVSTPAISPGWAGYTFWQDSDTAAVGGISGQADLDLMEGAPSAVTAGHGASGSVQLETLNSLAGQPVTYSATGSLPSYLSLSAAGRLSWTSSTPVGLHSVTVTPAGAVTPVPTSTSTSTAPAAAVIPSSVTATLRVHGTVTLPTQNRTSAAGTPISLRLTASGPDQTVGFAATFKASGLPSGLSMTSAGLITGWLSRPGTYTVKVTAADGLGGSGSASFAWTVKAVADSGTAGQVRQVGGSGKCLDDPSGQTANGTAVDLSTCTGKTSQRWTAVADGTLRTGGKCLNVAGNSSSSGARLELEPCNSANGAQLWEAATYGQLVNPQSGKCLDVPAASAANGTKPVIEPCAYSASQPNQHWIRPAAPILSGEPGKCAAVAGTSVVAANCAGTAAQRWQVYPDGTIRSNGKCLTETSVSLGPVLSLGSCSGAAATKWNLFRANAIASELGSTVSGYCVGYPSSGTRLTMQACANTAAATWHVE